MKYMLTIYMMMYIIIIIYALDMFDEINH